MTQQKRLDAIDEVEKLMAEANRLREAGKKMLSEAICLDIKANELLQTLEDNHDCV